MVRATLSILAIICLASVLASAQENRAQPAAATASDHAVAAARQHFRKGEACFQSGDMDCARREFDRAIDTILEIGVDVRADQQLQVSLREMIEAINRYQLAAFSDAKIAGWKTQEYEGQPVRIIAKTEEIDELDIPSGPLTPDLFQRQFAVLRNLFREKYGRDITLTGADHGEHRRLYGKGSAYDIRARDLNRTQVKFIIDTGTKLGLRIKDFSTWERVVAHNSRVVSLGRPLDTLATGLHLHIDRMGPAKKKPAAAKPAAKKPRGKIAGAKENE